MDEGERRDAPDYALKTFAAHEQYRTLNGRAHRKPPARIGSPALTRHIVLWAPKGGADASESFRDRRERWKADVDWFLANMLLSAYNSWRHSAIDRAVMDGVPFESQRRYRPISFNSTPLPKAHSEQEHYRVDLFAYSATFKAENLHDGGKLAYEPLENGKQGQARFETVSFRFYVDRVPIKMRAELHTEYVGISMSASLDTVSEEHRDLCVSDTCKDLAHHFSELHNMMMKRWGDCAAHQKGQPSPPTIDPQSEKQDTKDLEAASRYLYEEFWQKVDKTLIEPALKGTHFGPTRAALSDDGGDSIKNYLGEYIADLRGVIISGKIKDGQLALTRAFELRERTPLRDYVANGIIERPRRLDLLHAMMPLIDGARRICEASPPQEGSRHAVEYSACTAHRNRALYISALGPQSPWSEAKDPVFYAVFTQHRHRWQIGRLVDRLNTVGTLRVASLYDYSALDRAGYLLRDLSRNLDTLPGDPGERAATWRRLIGEFRALSALVGISSEGGIQYRAERSYFYVRQFQSEVQELDFRRVEGFQPYPSFVQRKLGQTWGYIAGLGARIDGIAARLNSLGNEVRIDEGIRAARRGIEEAKRVAALQELAERVSIIPIAYYLGSIVHYAFEALTHVATFPEGFPGPVGAYMIVAGFLYWRWLVAYWAKTRD